eukprot:2095860-Amphidinium_carterae.1
MHHAVIRLRCKITSDTSEYGMHIGLIPTSLWGPGTHCVTILLPSRHPQRTILGALLIEDTWRSAGPSTGIEIAPFHRNHRTNSFPDPETKRAAPDVHDPRPNTYHPLALAAPPHPALVASP